jgi:hypothetical protein
MARRRRTIDVFGLSFLDAITCGFGAIVLFFMIINAATGRRSGRMTADLQGEVDLLEVEVLRGHERLVELRNSLREADDQSVVARGLSRRVLEELERIRQELATYDETSLARREHAERLKADLRSLEEDVLRLQAASESEEVPGDRVRAHLGDGDRQYLTGLKLGGERIFILVDASASMLDETIVNVVRRRNLPESSRREADKWLRAVATVDWLTTQLPRQAKFQLYVFDTGVRPVLAESDGTWLDAGDRATLDRAVAGLRATAPAGGTSLYHAFGALTAMNPRPDNLLLLTDGLPTQGSGAPRRATVTSEERFKLFGRAIQRIPGELPVNVILFPIEGDPLAASAFWKLAMATEGSFLSPAEDWP